MATLDAAAFLHAALQAVALWTGLSLLLVLFLSARISGFRRRLKISTGDGGHDDLNAAVRAFGNAVEYLPMGLVAIAVVAMLGYGAWVVHLLGATLVLGRVFHAWGMGQSKQPAPGRVIGMLLTYLTFIGAAAALIIGVFL